MQLAEHARNELAARQTRRRMTELSDHQSLSLTGLGEEEAENVLFACGACRQPLMDRGDRPSVPTTSDGSRRSTLMSPISSIHRRLSARSPVVEHPHCNNPIASIPTSRAVCTGEADGDRNAGLSDANRFISFESPALRSPSAEAVPRSRAVCTGEASRMAERSS
jgi:hypothetical protein